MCLSTALPASLGGFLLRHPGCHQTSYGVINGIEGREAAAGVARTKVLVTAGTRLKYGVPTAPLMRSIRARL